jgi:hypothetical protein
VRDVAERASAHDLLKLPILRSPLARQTDTVREIVVVALRRRAEKRAARGPLRDQPVDIAGSDFHSQACCILCCLLLFVVVYI